MTRVNLFVASRCYATVEIHHIDITDAASARPPTTPSSCQVLCPRPVGGCGRSQCERPSLTSLPRNGPYRGPLRTPPARQWQWHCKRHARPDPANKCCLPLRDMVNLRSYHVAGALHLMCSDSLQPLLETIISCQHRWRTSCQQMPATPPLSQACDPYWRGPRARLGEKTAAVRSGVDVNLSAKGVMSLWRPTMPSRMRAPAHSPTTLSSEHVPFPRPEGGC